MAAPLNMCKNLLGPLGAAVSLCHRGHSSEKKKSRLTGTAAAGHATHPRSILMMAELVKIKSPELLVRASLQLLHLKSDQSIKSVPPCDPGLVVSGANPMGSPGGWGSQRDLAESQRQAGAVLGAGERGAAAAPQLDRPARPARRASQPQQEVVVGGGVHGVKDVGVVRDHQFFKKKKREIQKRRAERKRTL